MVFSGKFWVVNPANFSLVIYGDLTRIEKVINNNTKRLIHHFLWQRLPELALLKFSVMFFYEFLDQQDGLQAELPLDVFGIHSDYFLHVISVDITLIFKTFVDFWP